MDRGLWGGALAVGLVALGYGACGRSSAPSPPPSSDGGTGPEVDGGMGSDGGTDEDGGTALGSWPADPVLNYSEKYGIPDVQSVGIDDGLNIWLLAGDRIGVLQPDYPVPIWASGIGQAAQGFGASTLATGSTVVCGGAAGKAYVGYATTDTPNYHTSPHDFAYKQGDMDIVQLDPDGRISLEQHVTKTNPYAGKPQGQLGIRNSNSWQWDEDRSVWTCLKVTAGPYKGDVFIGTNHGVTRIRGDTYKSHIHPVWMDSNGSVMAGYTYALGLTPEDDVFIGNDWLLGLVRTDGVLDDWDKTGEGGPTQFRFAGSIPDMAQPPAFAYWRGVAALPDPSGQYDWYFMGSKDFGLWQTVFRERKDAQGNLTDLQVDPELPGPNGSWSPGFRKVPFATDHISALQATKDGSLFIGTEGSGLYRMTADGVYARVDGVEGGQVRQLVYDESQAPSMLLALTDAGLFVLRIR